MRKIETTMMSPLQSLVGEIGNAGRVVNGSARGTATIPQFISCQGVL